MEKKLTDNGSIMSEGYGLFFRLHQFWHWVLHARRKCQEGYQYKSVNCRRLALLHPFLNQQELDDLSKKKTGSPLCCDICVKLNPDRLALSGIEKLLSTDCDVGDENANLVSDSSDDTVSYDYFVYESFDNLP